MVPGGYYLCEEILDVFGDVGGVLNRHTRHLDVAVNELTQSADV